MSLLGGDVEGGDRDTRSMGDSLGFTGPNDDSDSHWLKLWEKNRLKGRNKQDQIASGSRAHNKGGGVRGYATPTVI